ncbi:MAG TPA: carboxypeptidase-like regulatory domain-containing protein, partial [Longimicrobiales bacterium]|nr:carboxypeptidase-like regulatory domain-containing protein [Longimicrobiales bacterium]
MKSRISVAFATVIFSLLTVMSGTAQVPAGGRPANPTAIIGTVADSAGRPLAGAAVTIKQGEAAGIVTGALTDAKDKFRIEGLSTGKYRVHISYIGFKANQQEIELSSSALTSNLGAVKLATDAIAVEGVTATALRSSMTVGVDRNIYSTKNMPAASGGNTTDLLRNVPELDVDVDGN